MITLAAGFDVSAWGDLATWRELGPGVAAAAAIAVAGGVLARRAGATALAVVVAATAVALTLASVSVPESPRAVASHLLIVLALVLTVRPRTAPAEAALGLVVALAAAVLDPGAWLLVPAVPAAALAGGDARQRRFVGSALLAVALPAIAVAALLWSTQRWSPPWPPADIAGLVSVLALPGLVATLAAAVAAGLSAVVRAAQRRQGAAPPVSTGRPVVVLATLVAVTLAAAALGGLGSERTGEAGVTSAAGGSDVGGEATVDPAAGTATATTPGTVSGTPGAAVGDSTPGAAGSTPGGAADTTGGTAGTAGGAAGTAGGTAGTAGGTGSSTGAGGASDGTAGAASRPAATGPPGQCPPPGAPVPGSTADPALLAAAAQLRQNRNITLCQAGAAALDAGQVDGRLLAILALLADGHTFRVDDIAGDAARLALLESVTGSEAPAVDAAVWLRAQRGAYAPRTVEVVGRDGLYIRYGDIPGS